jgi:hypothetical protein
MSRFNLSDLHALEAAPTSCRAKVEAVNPETGEYRIVLQGTLDQAAASVRFSSSQP